MSRFKHLRKYLPFSGALKVYLKIRKKDYDNWPSAILQYPFHLRKNNIFDFFTYEEVILKRSYDISFGFSPKTIIDGGGNIGLTAAFWATKYPGATIVSLEPDGDNFAMLRRNTAPYKNVHAFRGGVWPKTAHLVVKDIGHGNNGFIVEEADAATPGAVPAFSIADILTKMNWPSVDVVKLDVEGSEKEIFSSNYESWLPKARVVVVEMHDRMRKGCSKAVFQAFHQYDFSFAIAGENAVFTNNAVKKNEGKDC